MVGIIGKRLPILWLFFLFVNFFTSALAADPVIGHRTITFVNQCPYPVWFGITGGATPPPGNCRADADCVSGAICADRGDAGKRCFWKNPVPNNNQFMLRPNGGSNSVQLPMYRNNEQIIWSGAAAGRRNCTAKGCEVADCSESDGACKAARGFTQPATQAEFTFVKNGPDFYDVEVINGISLPTEMSPNFGGITRCQGPNCANPYQCGSPGSPDPITQTGKCRWQISPPSNDYNWVKLSSRTCNVDSDCPGTKCGLAFDPVKNNYVKVCGKLLGYWSDDQICGTNPRYGAPFNCAQTLPPPLQHLTLMNLFACTGAPIDTCYRHDARSTCCGCVNWDKIGIDVPPGPYTEQCVSTNPIWNAYVQPKLVWLKRACPSTYVYPYDDMSSTFVCQIARNGVNSVNYKITFCPGGLTGGIPA